MSTGVLVEDGVETIEHIVQQRIIDRASAHSESLPTESSHLLGYSKHTYPHRMYLLMLVIVIFTISAISTVPAGMDITYYFVCYFYKIDRDMCLRSDEAGEAVANFSAIASIFKGLLSLVVTSYLSALSDRRGRRPLIILAMLLTGLAHISSWYIVFHLPNPSTYWWLIVPTIIDSLGGSAQFVEMMCVVYVSDMVPDARQRARLIAQIDGCFFASLAIGPTLGSFVIRTFGIEVLYVATACGSFLAATLAILFLKESLSHYHQRRNSTSVRSLGGSMDLLLFRAVPDAVSRKNARILFVLALSGTELVMTFIPLLLLYPKRVFGWSAVETGYLVSGMSATRTLWFLVGFPVLFNWLSTVYTAHTNKIDRVDITLLRAGITLSIVGYLGLGWSKTSGQYSLAGIIDASSAIGSPIYKSAMLKYVPQGQFGTYMAGFNLAAAAVGVLLPTAFLKLYSWALTWRAYLPFEVISACFGVVLLATFLLKPAY